MEYNDLHYIFKNINNQGNFRIINTFSICPFKKIKQKETIPVSEVNEYDQLINNNIGIKAVSRNTQVNQTIRSCSPKKKTWTLRESIEINDKVFEIKVPGEVLSFPKYILNSNINSFVRFKNDYFQTDDHDLYLLFKYINEDVSNWEKVVSNNIISCYRRPVPGSKSILIKAVALIDGHDCEKIFKAIYDVKLRMSWDTVFKDFKIVREEKDDVHEVIYMAFQSPVFLIDNRDFVQQRKKWKNLTSDEMRLIHFKSVEVPECPIRSKHVRAETTISGYYIETISRNPLKTRLIIIANNDIKGYIPISIVNAAAAKSPKQWVENLIKGCSKIKD